MNFFIALATITLAYSLYEAYKTYKHNHSAKNQAHTPRTSHAGQYLNTTQNTPRARAAHNTKKQKYITHKHTRSDKARTSKDPTKAAKPKETGAKCRGEASKAGGAKSQKGNSAKTEYDQHTKAERVIAYPETIQSLAKTLHQSGDNMPAKLIFYSTLTKKYKILFYCLVYFGKNRRLFTMPLWIFAEYQKNMRGICENLVNI